jgi:hypothetical protein
VFEPDQFAGRQTALYLYDERGHLLSPRGTRLADFSEQNLPATGSIPLSLLGKRLVPPPPHAGVVPLSGVLVYSYPIAELRSARTMVLFVHEFGSGLEDERSVGVFRLAPGKSEMRAVYQGAVI